MGLFNKYRVGGAVIAFIVLVFFKKQIRPANDLILIYFGFLTLIFTPKIFRISKPDYPSKKTRKTFSLSDEIGKWSDRTAKILENTRKSSNCLASIFFYTGFVIIGVHIVRFFGPQELRSLGTTFSTLPIIDPCWKYLALAFIVGTFALLYGKLCQIKWARKRSEILDEVTERLRKSGFPILGEGRITKERYSDLIESLLVRLLDCTNFGLVKKIWKWAGGKPKVGIIYLPDGDCFRIWHLAGRDRFCYEKVQKKYMPAICKVDDWEKEVKQIKKLNKDDEERREKSQQLFNNRHQYFSDIGIIYNFGLPEISTNLEKCLAHDPAYIDYLEGDHKFIHRFRSLMGVPLRNKEGEIIGVLALYGCGKWSEFDTVDLRYARIFKHLFSVLVNFGIECGFYNSRDIFESYQEERP